MARWSGGSAPRRRSGWSGHTANSNRSGPSTARCSCRTIRSMRPPAGRRTWTAASCSTGSTRVTGQELSKTILYHLDPQTGKQLVPEAKFNMEGTTSDILSGDGELVFLKYFTFDRDGKRTDATKPHPFSITGFLGEEWFVRNYWIIGEGMPGAGWGGWANAANAFPSGQILCFNDDSRIRLRPRKSRRRPGRPPSRRLPAVRHGPTARRTAARRQEGKAASHQATAWTDTQSLIVRAMVTRQRPAGGRRPAGSGAEGSRTCWRSRTSRKRWLVSRARKASVCGSSTRADGRRSPSAHCRRCRSSTACRPPTAGSTSPRWTARCFVTGNEEVSRVECQTRVSPSACSGRVRRASPALHLPPPNARSAGLVIWCPLYFTAKSLDFAKLAGNPLTALIDPAIAPEPPAFVRNPCRHLHFCKPLLELFRVQIPAPLRYGLRGVSS